MSEHMESNQAVSEPGALSPDASEAPAQSSTPHGDQGDELSALEARLEARIQDEVERRFQSAKDKRWAVTRGGMQRVYSGVPLAWLQDAAYPVVIDPDFSGDTGDAMIEGATVSTASVFSQATTLVALGGRTFGSATHVYRSYFKFDTSSIGASSTVDQANLRMLPQNINAYVSWTIYVRKYNWSSIDPLSNGSKETAWDGLYSASNDAALAHQNDQPGTYATSGNLSTSWISKTGDTYYGLWCNQEGYAFPNNQGAQHVYYTSEASPASNRPLMIIEYTLGNPQPLSIPLNASVLSHNIARYDTRVKLRADRRTTTLNADAGRVEHE